MLLPSLDTPKDRQLACRQTLAAGSRPAHFKSGNDQNLGHLQLVLRQRSLCKQPDQDFLRKLLHDDTRHQIRFNAGFLQNQQRHNPPTPVNTIAR